MLTTNTCKLVMLGDTGVGKSSLVARFVSDNFSEFQEPTIGAAFQVKNLTVDKKNNKIRNLGHS